MKLLQNKRIVVIGGTSGIGLASANLAKTQGAEVIVTGLNKSNGDHYVLDVTDEKGVKDFFSQVGEIDYLTIPGSYTPKGEFLTMETEIARKGFDSKFWGQYNAAKYAAPHIRKGGSIVFFSGVMSKRPEKNFSVMAAVNSAVEGLGRALAVELAPIRVNVIAPGIVDTPRYGAMAEQDRLAMYAKLSQKLPVGRIGTPEVLAQAVIYLMTNPYTTGQTLFVDGGHTLV